VSLESGSRDSNPVCLAPNQARSPLRDIPISAGVVDPERFELSPFSLQGSCSAVWSYKPAGVARHTRSPGTGPERPGHRKSRGSALPRERFLAVELAKCKHIRHQAVRAWVPGVEPGFRWFWRPAAYPLARPYERKTARQGLCPGGGVRTVILAPIRTPSRWPGMIAAATKPCPWA
jgi:hypothetical protein